MVPSIEIRYIYVHVTLNKSIIDTTSEEFKYIDWSSYNRVFDINMS